MKYSCTVGCAFDTIITISDPDVSRIPCRPYLLCLDEIFCGRHRELIQRNIPSNTGSRTHRELSQKYSDADYSDDRANLFTSNDTTLGDGSPIAGVIKPSSLLNSKPLNTASRGSLVSV